MLDPPMRPVISVVAPIFNEAPTVTQLVEQIVAAIEPIGEPFEIILVDDGSGDDTWERISGAAREHPEVRGVCLTRNFGQQKALLAGLSYASGRAVITLDGDLQHPPDIIPRLIEHWKNGAKIVHTVRVDPPGTGAFKRFTSRGFYRLFTALSGFEIPAGTSDFRLIDEDTLRVLLAMRDPEPFLRGAIHWIGGPVVSVAYDARPRSSGASKFGLARMLRLSSDGLVSYSTIPLKIGIWIGLVTSALAFAEIVYILVAYARGRTVPGWASVLTVVSFMFGVLFVLLGILGTYMASIHLAVKDRPPFLVERTLGLDRERHGGRRR